MMADAKETAGESPPAEKPEGATRPAGDMAVFLEAFKGTTAKPKEGEDGESHEGDEPPGDEESPEGKPRSKSKPKTLEALAESLELDVKDLYAVEVPSSRKGEEPYTLGKLKDLAVANDDLQVRTLQLDSDRRLHERQRVEAEREVREMLAVLPDDALKPKALEAVRNRIAQKQELERGLMLDTIPEWKDAERRLSDLKGMTDFLSGYGVAESFLLLNFDHKLIRMVRDSWMLAENVRKALEVVKERKGSTPPRSKSAADGGVRKKNSAAPPAGRRTGEQVRGFLDSIAEAAAKRH
jgi:hypothetical protein